MLEKRKSCIGGQATQHEPWQHKAFSFLIICLMATIRKSCQCINLVTGVFSDSLSSAKSHNSRITFPYQKQWYINSVITFNHKQTQPHILTLKLFLCVFPCPCLNVIMWIRMSGIYRETGVKQKSQRFIFYTDRLLFNR